VTIPAREGSDAFRPTKTARLHHAAWRRGRRVAARGARGAAGQTTDATPPTLAAKQATAVIPIVFAAASDPVGTGLVASLARPGGNVTGLANQISDTGGKKLELLREAVPGLRRLAIIANVGNPASVLDMGEAQATARSRLLDRDVAWLRDRVSHARIGRVVVAPCGR
jgi:ABC transporter substrate binding protein